MTITKVNDKYRITLPSVVRDKLHIEIGDIVEIIVRDEDIILRPKKLIDSSQIWFWSKQWQEKEKEVDSDYESGRYKTAKDAKDFLKQLHDED